MRFDGMVFDLDGTLWDPLAVCTTAWNRVVQRTDPAIPAVSSERLRSLMGQTHQGLMAGAFPDLPDEVRDPLVRACYAEEQTLLREADVPALMYPGVADGLAALAKQARVFIVSNCQTGYMRAFLSGSGLAGLVADWECFGRTGRAKGENLKAVVARNGLRRPVYVGDTTGDEEAARLAGVPFVHAAWGYGTAAGECDRANDFRSLVGLLLAG